MNNSEKTSYFHSLRGKLILWIIILLLPILVLLLVCTTAITRSFEQQMDAYVQEMVSPFRAEIDALLAAARRYIAEQKLDLSVMDSPDVRHQLENLQKTQALGDQISDNLAAYPDINAIFLYNGTDLWFIYNYDCSYPPNQGAAAYLEAYLAEYPEDSPIFQAGYLPFSTNGTGWLFSAINVPGGIIGCWFQDTSLLQSLNKAKLPGLEAAVFSDAEGQPLNAAFAGEWDNWHSDYFVTEQALSSAPLTLTAFWDRGVIFSALYHVVYLVAVCLLIVAVLYIGYVFFIGRSVIRPLNRLVKVIRGMGKTNFAEIEVSPRDPTEVQDVFRALNSMTREVKNLKIRVYEEQLVKQNTQLQLYQLQLKPHFFLNVFNTIISFARTSNYDMVQKLTLFLAAHCRYVLYNTRFVTVEEELEYTQNYMDIQTIWHTSPASLHYHTEVSESVLDYSIPILCIQIFVENALKYARSSDKQVDILVSAGFCPGREEELFRIMIDDTGGGFSPEELKELAREAAEPSCKTRDHGIGIANVRQRLSLLYHGRASASFSNNPKGGAHVELIFPVEIDEKEPAQ